MKIAYSAKVDPETTARCRGKELHISPKHAREICCSIKGMPLPKARAFLEDVKSLKKPVPFKRFNSNIGHKKNMMAGRYPQKAAGEFLRLLTNLESNAQYKGLDPEEMKIIHASTCKGHTFRGLFAKSHGRGALKRGETVNVEIIAEEA